ncbi:condensin-2 complex subunit G2-like isoform X2 [Clavelina lepadiformis]|uniref:condensin-2 complex subunit G2-like isoform X2 n=1 Tax=Clavelina lepadiformis TaxID=159417 RepID=UPI0040432113
MRPRESLLHAAENGCESMKQFFTLLKIDFDESIVVTQGKKKVKINKLTTCLSECLQEINLQEHEQLWENVQNICVDCLQEFANCVSDEDGNKLQKNETFSAVIAFFENISFLALAALRCEISTVPVGLLSVVLILHGSILDFGNHSSRLAKNICTVCIEWWERNLINKEEVVLNVLIYLLNDVLGAGLSAKAFSTSSTKLNEIFKIQKALTQFDFSDGIAINANQDIEYVQELKQLLVASFVHPAFLKAMNGRKFLAHVMLLHEDLMKAVHRNIVCNVTSPSKSKHFEAYGNIYYLAWNLAEEEFKDKVEDFCIQDVMFKAIHAHHEGESATIFVAYRSMLNAIVCHKGVLQVSHMVTRLYAPIIWRSLKAVNAMVRSNAANLLFDAFPLREPSDALGQDRDELLQRQFSTFEELLMDTHPQIRTIAVFGICKVLNLYWDVIPAQVIAVLARNLYTNLAFDCSSIHVRVAVCKNWVERCVKFYAENPTAARKFYLHAQNQLTAMEAGEFIFMISMFVFNHVAKSLQENVEETDEESTGNAETATITDNLEAIAGLLETICILWMAFSKKVKSVSQRQSGKQDKSTDNSRELTKRVLINLPRMIHICFKKFNDERNLNALMQLSSCLEPGSMPIFSNKVLPKLESLPDGSSSAYYSMLIRCLIKWRWPQQILDLIYNWLLPATQQDKGNKENEAKSNKNTRRVSTRVEKKKEKSKSVKFTVVEKEPRPHQALRYLATLLDDDEIMLTLLANNGYNKTFNNISACLQNYVLELMSCIEGKKCTLQNCDNSMLYQAFDLQFKLLIHIYYAATRDDHNSTCETAFEASYALQKLKSLIEMLQVDLIGQLKLSAQFMENHNASSLSVTLNSSIVASQNRSDILSQLTSIKECLNVGIPAMINLVKSGIPVAENILSFLTAFTETGIKTVDYAGHIGELLHQLFEWFILYVWSNNEKAQHESKSFNKNENEDTLLQIFDDVMIALMMYSRKNPDGFHELFKSQVRSHLRACVQILFQFCENLTKQVYDAIATKFISAILADIGHHASASEFRVCDKINDLPQFGACFLPVICGTSPQCAKVCRTIIPSLFEQDADAETKQIAHKPTIILLHALVKDGKNQNAARKCLAEIQENHEEMAKAAESLSLAMLA